MKDNVYSKLTIENLAKNIQYIALFRVYNIFKTLLTIDIYAKYLSLTVIFSNLI